MNPLDIINSVMTPKLDCDLLKLDIISSVMTPKLHCDLSSLGVNTEFMRSSRFILP